MKVKTGVSVAKCKGVMFHAAIVAEQVFRHFGYAEAIITGGDEDGHRTRKHPDGEALDFRIWYLAKESVVAIADEIRRRLPEDYDVVVEADHIHVEWDPK